MKTLYRAPFSTNVERVALALAHKGVEVESVVIGYDDRSLVERVSGQPLVPVLVDDGLVVTDSMRIIRHLEARYPDPPLYPSQPHRLAEMLIFIDWFNRVWKVAPNAIEAELPPGLARHSPRDRSALARWPRRSTCSTSLLTGREFLLGDRLLGGRLRGFPFLKFSLGRPPGGDDSCFTGSSPTTSLLGPTTLAWGLDRPDGCLPPGVRWPYDCRVSTGWVWDERYMWHQSGSFADWMPLEALYEPEPSLESPATKRRFKNLVDVSGMAAHLTAIRRAAGHGAGAGADPHRGVHRVDPGALGRRAAARRGRARRLAAAASRSRAWPRAAASRRWTPCSTARSPTSTRWCARPAIMPSPIAAVGYCIFANAAIAVKHAQADRGLDRVAIVDWDVHHGNGSEIGVLRRSLGADHLAAPGGALSRRGAAVWPTPARAPVLGYNLNIPLPAGTGRGRLRARVRAGGGAGADAFAPRADRGGVGSGCQLDRSAAAA